MRNLNPQAVAAVQQTPARIIKTAAALVDRSQWPAGVAYSRSRLANGSARRAKFWHSVGRALTEAYDVRCGIRSDYGNAMREAIDAARTAS